MRWPSFFGTLVGVALVALVAIELLSPFGSNQGPRPAPALPNQGLRGPRVTLASLRGRPALINFWASWCGPCKQEAPELERFARSHPQAQLVGVDWNDDLGSARAFARQHAWSFPVLRDPSGAVGDRYGLTGLPATFVLDSRGRIVNVLPGPQTVPSLTIALRRSRSLEPVH